MKGKIKYLIIGIIILPLCLWVGSLVKCEVLTHMHYDEFKNIYSEDFNDIEFFKVLKYSQNDLAEVYYVSEDYSMGTVLRLKYNQDTATWETLAYVTGWSTTGNADNLVYPYLWHFKYFMYEH